MIERFRAKLTSEIMPLQPIDMSLLNTDCLFSCAFRAYTTDNVADLADIALEALAKHICGDLGPKIRFQRFPDDPPALSHQRVTTYVQDNVVLRVRLEMYLDNERGLFHQITLSTYAFDAS